ncbi:MAG TPA: luciferase family protein [Candidatus Angelobacter sp.]
MTIESLKKVEEQVSTWPGITVHPHRFGGLEFCLGSAEVGHMHNDGAVEIPFPRALRDALLDEGHAQEHRWAPDSGWITFPVRAEQDTEHALWLLRLSYLRYALKAVPDPGKRFAEESERLCLSPRLKSLLERFVPRKRKEELVA